jgi:hypothetical protein
MPIVSCLIVLCIIMSCQIISCLYNMMCLNRAKYILIVTNY